MVDGGPHQPQTLPHSTAKRYKYAMLKLKSVNFDKNEFQHHCLAPTYVGQREWSLGRHPSCDLVLSSPEVSRTHGRIIYQDDAYHLMDDGSTSGTMLNGKCLPPKAKQPLALSDLIQLGETLLYVEELVPLTSLTNCPETPTLSGAVSLTPWSSDLTCRCCRIVEETSDVKTFSFIAEPAILFHYQPGQFVRLAIEINGQRVIRPYSISSSPTRPYHLDITIKRVPSPGQSQDIPAGLVSNWMHDQFRVGDRLQIVGGPMGQFTCLLPDSPSSPPSKLLLLSAGSGITPMMSMSRWVQDTLSDCDVVFLHSARTPEDLVFRRELEAMDAQMPNFRLAVTVTQRSPGQSWLGMTGRVSEAMLHLVVPDWRERSVYVCGSQGFMKGMRATLTQMGFPMEQYREESFGGAQPATVRLSGQDSPREDSQIGDAPRAEMPSQQPAAQFAVQFTESGCEVPTDGRATILQLAEERGVAIASACRMGACGACKVRIGKGKVAYGMPPQALTAVEQEAGYGLACVAYPQEAVEVQA